MIAYFKKKTNLKIIIGYVEENLANFNAKFAFLK